MSSDPFDESASKIIDAWYQRPAGFAQFDSRAIASLSGVVAHYLRQAKADGWSEGYDKCFNTPATEKRPPNPYATPTKQPATQQPSN